MTEAEKRRRRWPWMVFLSLLLVTVGAIAWRFRPLNSTESYLVGHWRIVSRTDVPYVRSFRADKTFKDTTENVSGQPCGLTGIWTASGTEVYLYDIKYWPDSAPRLVISRWQRVKDALGLGVRLPGLRIDGPDHFWHGGSEFVRVADDAPPVADRPDAP